MTGFSEICACGQRAYRDCEFYPRGYLPSIQYLYVLMSI